MQNLLAAVVVLHVQGSLPRSGSYNRSSFGSERVRLVVGGSLQSDSPVVNIFKGYNPNGVKFITAAGINPALDAVTITLPTVQTEQTTRITFQWWRRLV